MLFAISDSSSVTLYQFDTASLNIIFQMFQVFIQILFIKENISFFIIFSLFSENFSQKILIIYLSKLFSIISVLLTASFSVRPFQDNIS
jgi:hypothetical protein